MKNRFYILLIILVFGCTQEEKLTAPVENANFGYRDFPFTWRLVEIKDGDNNWEPVGDSLEHNLTFLNSNSVLYTSSSDTCEGTYVLRNDKPLIIELHLPCIVPAEHMWWEHIIVDDSTFSDFSDLGITSESTFITKIRLQPSARVFNIYYKYQLVPSKDEATPGIP